MLDSSAIRRRKVYTYRKFKRVWKISGRFPLTQKVCQIFFIVINTSGIFLSPFKTSRRKIMRKIHKVHSSSVAEKFARFDCFLSGIPFTFLRILYLSRKLVRKVHIGTLLLISRNGIPLCFLPGIPLPFFSIFKL